MIGASASAMVGYGAPVVKEGSACRRCGSGEWDPFSMPIVTEVVDS